MTAFTFPYVNSPHNNDNFQTSFENLYQHIRLKQHGIGGMTGMFLMLILKLGQTLPLINITLILLQQISLNIL